MNPNEEHIKNIYAIFTDERKKLNHIITTNINKHTKYKEYFIDRDIIMSDVMINIIEQITKSGFEMVNKHSYWNYISMCIKNYILADMIKREKSIMCSYDEILNTNDDDSNGFDYIQYKFEPVDDVEEFEERKLKEINQSNNFDYIIDLIDRNESHCNSSFFKYRFAYNYSIREISELTGYTASQIFYRTDKMMKKYKEELKNDKNIKL